MYAGYNGMELKSRAALAIDIGASVRKRALSGRTPAFLLVAIFSLLYFAETIVRASEKPFWFDELCTLYIVRLPSFAASWSAVLHGADYNPPLFYLIQRADRELFGEGLIAMRLPAIIGFWTLCLCLFRFASRCAGPVAGWIAMVMPVFTGAYYYAYEARPHGIVLGFCGLALVCWQASEDQRPYRTSWLLAFTVFSSAAFLTHCYALVIVIPFWLAEAAYVVRQRQLRPLRWTVLTVPALLCAISFIPLLGSYRANVAHTEFSSSFAPHAAQLLGFYNYLAFPCFSILLLVLALLVIDGFRQKSKPEIRLPSNDGSLFGSITLAVAFLLVPCFGLAMALVTHGPFVPRYFLTAVIGLASVVTLALSSSLQRWKTLTVAAVLSGMLLLDARRVLWHYHQGYGDAVTEQSSGFLIEESGNPLVFYPLITGAPKDLPIIVAAPLDFLYLVYYAPSRTQQLFYLTNSKNELFYRLYSALRQWCRIDYNPVQTVSEFLPQHRSFLVYGASEFDPWLYSLVGRGARMSSIKFADRGRFLANLQQGPPAAPPLSQTGLVSRARVQTLGGR